MRWHRTCGYGRSGRPEEVEKYTILHDIGDIVGLVDALAARQAVIAGHDIGATIAWQAALLRPDRRSAILADLDHRAGSDVCVTQFTRSGFRGPLAWWHNIDRSWELMASFAGAAVIIPALHIAGDRDFVAAALSRSIAGQSAVVRKLRPPMMLPGCGHRTEQERAPEVNAATIDRLRRV
jgi:pimeloyl-ACP methyl ester carboxylesterase